MVGSTLSVSFDDNQELYFLSSFGSALLFFGGCVYFFFMGTFVPLTLANRRDSDSQKNCWVVCELYARPLILPFAPVSAVSSDVVVYIDCS